MTTLILKFEDGKTSCRDCPFYTSLEMCEIPYQISKDIDCRKVNLETMTCDKVEDDYMILKKV